MHCIYLIVPQEQHLRRAYETLVEATACLDMQLDSKNILASEDEQWAQYAVQSIVWRLAGK